MNTWVVKYGGSVADEAGDLLREIARMVSREGDRVAVVHGGGPEITQLLERLGHASPFADGQRVTDEITLDAAEMVLAGRVGKRIVRRLQRAGVMAVGLSGEDGGLVRAELYDATGRLGRVGRVTAVRRELVDLLWQAGYVPVLAPLGLGPDGEPLNINADFVAGALAGALGADMFVLATDVPGVKESRHAQHAIPELSAAEAREMIGSGAIAGGMIPKVEAALAAVDAGAGAAHIVDGRRSAILAALRRGEPVGTRIVRGASPVKLIQGSGESW